MLVYAAFRPVTREKSVGHRPRASDALCELRGDVPLGCGAGNVQLGSTPCRVPRGSAMSIQCGIEATGTGSVSLPKYRMTYLPVLVASGCKQPGVGPTGRAFIHRANVRGRAFAGIAIYHWTVVVTAMNRCSPVVPPLSLGRYHVGQQVCGSMHRYEVEPQIWCQPNPDARLGCTGTNP